MWRIILTVIQVFSAFSIIGLVLLQRGKGAEAGAGFGAGASGTVFGARGASTALSRATAIFAAIFMINSLLLTYVGTKISDSQPRTILDQATEGSPRRPQVRQRLRRRTRRRCLRPHQPRRRSRHRLRLRRRRRPLRARRRRSKLRSSAD